MINLNFSLVVAFLYVLILYAFMNYVFFKPILRILRERRRLIQGRLEDAQARMAEVDKKAAEYESALRAARADAYRQQEVRRNQALDEKSELIAEAKREAERAIQNGRARITADAEAARQRLRQDIDALAQELSATVLKS